MHNLWVSLCLGFPICTCNALIPDRQTVRIVQQQVRAGCEQGVVCVCAPGSGSLFSPWPGASQPYLPRPGLSRSHGRATECGFDWSHEGQVQSSPLSHGPLSSDTGLRHVGLLASVSRSFPAKVLVFYLVRVLAQGLRRDLWVTHGCPFSLPQPPDTASGPHEGPRGQVLRC